MSAEPVKEYVLGFMYYREEGHEARQGVVLIKKNRPEWQAGKLNGIGGKIEPGETPIQAMVREFEEETGMATTPDAWRHVLTMSLESEAERARTGRAAIVHVMACKWPRRPPATSKTDERVMHVPAGWACLFPHVPNLVWLLPLCQYADTKQPFTMEMAS